MGKSLLLVILCFFSVEQIKTQEQLKIDTIRALKEFKHSEEAIAGLIESYDGNHKSDFLKVMKESKMELKEGYRNVYFNEPFDDYLNQIVKTIKSYNPQIQSLDIRPYFYYDPSPNACMVYDGTMFVNLGLFDIIENESQLAMVIAHEISHYSENHGYKNIIKSIEKKNSRELERKYKEAAREDINRLDRLSKLFKSETINFRRHSRKYEKEADSIGLAYLKNTPYALDEAIYGIKVLKKSDTESFNINSILKHTFDFEESPFKSKWIRKSMSIGDKMRYRLSEKKKDSLRTHPKTEIRFKLLQSKIKDEELRDIAEVSNETFQKIGAEFRIQIVDYLIYEKRLSEAMYHILKYQNQGDNREYFKSKLYQVLVQMKNALDNHNLAKYVESRNPYYLPQYNNLLIFIDNLNVEDFESLKENYKLKHKL